FGDEAERPRWSELLRSGVYIFALDYDAILPAMYALSVSAEGDCYLCVLPDPGIEAAALGASESALPGTAPTEALHTFTLDSGASRCFFRDSLHLPSFSTNLVSTAALQDAMVTTTTPGGQRVSICTCTRMGRHLATLTRRPGSILYTLTTETAQVATSGQVSASVRLQLRERFCKDLPVYPLHSNRGGEFSSDLLWDFCRGEGILHSFTLPASPQQNEIAKHRIGLVMEVARTSMIHAVAPHFLSPFAGSRAFVRDTSADKLSARAIPCVFLGFVPDAPGWQFYHPTSRRVLPSQGVTFDESVPFYRLFPYRTAPLPPPAALPRSRSPSDSGAAGGGAARGAAFGGAEPVGAEPGDVEP
ncbi:unnamed protein product, partial [Closterium sp. NIES-54]